jgi:hypothetical protein
MDLSLGCKIGFSAASPSAFSVGGLDLDVGAAWAAAWGDGLGVSAHKWKHFSVVLALPIL